MWYNYYVKDREVYKTQITNMIINYKKETYNGLLN
jgi:hypothetical protein